MRRSIELSICCVIALELAACDSQLSAFDRVDVAVSGAEAVGAKSAEPTPVDVEPVDAATAGQSQAAGTAPGPATADSTQAGADSSESQPRAPGSGGGAAAGDGSHGDGGDTAAGTETASSADSGTDTDTGTGTGTDSRDLDPPVVNAGADAVARASFVRVANATDASALSVEWSQVSGPGTISFSAATATTTSITASGDGIYVIRLTATDAGGLAASDEFQLRWDATPPSDLTALAVTTGDDVGTVEVTVDFDSTPAVLDDYDVVRIVRGATGGAAASCSTSAVVHSFTAGQFLDGTFTDFTNVAGASFAYRACIYDAAGNLTAGQTGTGVSKRHLLFVGLPGGFSAPGDFGLPAGTSGVVRGDSVCQSEAASSSHAEVLAETNSHWHAVLSDSVTDAKWRTVILGQVVNPAQNETYAADRDGLWGALLGPDAPDDDAYGGSVFASVWTGSDSGGLRSGQHCNDWTDGGAGSGSVGDPTATTSAWLDAGSPLACNDGFGAGVYCINQPAPPTGVALAAAATSSASVTLSVTAPADAASLARIDRLTLRRRADGSFPDGNCAGAGDTLLAIGFGSGFPGYPVAGELRQVVDANAVASATTYRYRVCAYDLHGNLLSSTAGGPVTTP